MLSTSTSIPTPASIATSTPTSTSARLVFERVGPCSVVRSAFATSPLRLLTPRNHGHAAWAYTSTLGGGLVGGDEVRLEVRVGGGAAAVLATQGETRVYRSSRGCRSELVARVGEGGLLALLPDPTVCFAGASYRQRTEVRLDPRASLVLVEKLAAGRSARGERWAFRRYEGDLTVHRGDRGILAESVLLDPAHGPIAGRFGDFDALCTVLLVGDALAGPVASIASELASQPASVHAGRIESANLLAPDALLIRMAATSVEGCLRSVRERLRFLPLLLGDDPWARRP